MPSDHPPTATAPTRWPARYSDGRTADARDVTVSLAATGLQITGHNPDASTISLHWPYADLTAATPLKATDRDGVFSLGERSAVSLFINHPAFLQALAIKAPHLTEQSFRRSGLRVAAPVSLTALALAAVVAVFDLSPAKGLARLVPEAARARIGDAVLNTLPVKTVCSNDAGRAALDALVVRLRPDLKGREHKVRVLDWSLVNAFAVPGGSVVLTRGILNQAASAEEIAGVLAHEMGHGMELHPEAGLVRSVGLWAALQMMFTGTPGVAGNLGSVLVQLAYSRAYEREADTVALTLLRNAEIANQPFAGFFRRMEQRRGSKSNSRAPGGRPTELFQTHPGSSERIARIESMQAYPTRPALTDPQWLALRGICGGRPTTPAGTTTTDIRPKTPTPGDGIADADTRVRANPTSAAAFAARANLHLRDRRFKEAIADFTRAIELDPSSAFYHFGRGRAHHNAADHAAAVADYTAAVRLNPRFSSAYAARGAIHRLENRPRQARKDLDDAIGINPRNDYALYQRGLLNAAERRWADSEADFARVIAQQKAYALAHVRRAEALEALGRRDDAMASYRDALAASPSSPDASLAFEMARARLSALGKAP